MKHRGDLKDNAVVPFALIYAEVDKLQHLCSQVHFSNCSPLIKGVRGLFRNDDFYEQYDYAKV